MLIDEAIEILTLDIESGCSTPPADLDKAEQLGVEALKLVQHRRKLPAMWMPPLLPGETEG